MAIFVVEAYVAPRRAGERSSLDRRVRAVAAALACEGVPVTYVRSVFVPEDEICLYFFEAAGRDAVVEASRRARLSFERIVEALE